MLQYQKSVDDGGEKKFEMFGAEAHLWKVFKPTYKIVNKGFGSL